MHAYTYIDTHIYIYIFIYIYILVYTSIYACVYLHSHIHEHMFNFNLVVGIGTETGTDIVFCDVRCFFYIQQITMRRILIFAKPF